MPEEQPKKTRRFRWTKGLHFEAKRVDGAMAEIIYTGQIAINFYIVRDEFEAVFEHAVLENGETGELQSVMRDTDVVFEYQQGVHLDEVDARNLRDQLNELLDEPSE